MLQKYEDADRVFREGEPILGRGWKEVEAFDDLEDVDEYESDEEVRLVSESARQWAVALPLLIYPSHLLKLMLGNVCGYGSRQWD